MKKSESAKSIFAHAEQGKSDRDCARLLIVEDSASSRAMIRHHMEEEQFDCEEAENGAIAVEKAKAKRFDMILMDIQMPMMDGLEAMRRIRQWEEMRGLARTPMIAFAASSFDEDVQAALENGADLHVSKPVRKEALADAIRTLIGNRVDAAAIARKRTG